MQDSFGASSQENTPQQTSEQTPAVAERKSGKGWMAAAIILLIGVIALGVTEFLAYQEIEQKNQEITSLKGQISKAGEPKLADGAGDTGDKTTAVHKIEYSALEKKIAAEDKNSVLALSKIEYTDDGKYLFAMGSVTVKGAMGGAITTWYKSTEDGAEWKKLFEGQNFVECSKLSEEQLEIMEKYKTIDDDLPAPKFGCVDKDGKDWPDGFEND